MRNFFLIVLAGWMLCTLTNCQDEMAEPDCNCSAEDRVFSENTGELSFHSEQQYPFSIKIGAGTYQSVCNTSFLKGLFGEIETSDSTIPVKFSGYSKIQCPSGSIDNTYPDHSTIILTEINPL